MNDDTKRARELAQKEAAYWTVEDCYEAGTKLLALTDEVKRMEKREQALEANLSAANRKLDKALAEAQDLGVAIAAAREAVKG